MVWCNCEVPLWLQGGECGNCGGNIVSKEFKESMKKWAEENKQNYCSICDVYFCTKHGYPKQIVSVKKSGEQK